jgi:hypothetical protein
MNQPGRGGSGHGSVSQSETLKVNHAAASVAPQASHDKMQLANGGVAVDAGLKSLDHC